VKMPTPPSMPQYVPAPMNDTNRTAHTSGGIRTTDEELVSMAQEPVGSGEICMYVGHLW
jgi:hypothetical protein